MKRIDASPDGIHEISWSPDNSWVAYVSSSSGVRLANAETGEIRDVGPGAHPGITTNNGVIVERQDEIILVEGTSSRTLISKKDLIKDTPKRLPSVSRDGKHAIFVVHNVFDKKSESLNAYPYRHFIATIDLEGGNKPALTNHQWYGGTSAWFPNHEHFVHFQFDSTGGPRLHIADVSGEEVGLLPGLYPSISPDGQRIAARPRGGGALVVYTRKDTWDAKDVDQTVLRIPAENRGQLSPNPAIWIDNRYVIVDEGGVMWRLDTRRDKAEELKKFPTPAARRHKTSAQSPNGELVAMEVETSEGFELKIASVS